jgi:hypothetical protein
MECSTLTALSIIWLSLFPTNKFRLILVALVEGIVITIMLGDLRLGDQFQAGAQYCSLFYIIQTSSGALPASYSIGSRIYFLQRVKQPGHEADNLTPSTYMAKTKKT